MFAIGGVGSDTTVASAGAMGIGAAVGTLAGASGRPQLPNASAIAKKKTIRRIAYSFLIHLKV
jgi:uncharacterized membrane protein